MATVNVRSIKNKEQQIIELENTNVIILTETWFKNTDGGKAWIDTSDLNKNNLRIDTVNRTARKGCGRALLHRKEYITTTLETNLQLDTVEHGVWSTTIRNIKLILVGIFHQPIGSSTGNTHTRFLEEVYQLIQFLITNHTSSLARWLQHAYSGHRKSGFTNLQ